MIGLVKDISVQRFTGGEFREDFYKLRVDFEDGAFDEIVFPSYLLEAISLSKYLYALGEVLEKRHNALLREILAKSNN